MFQPGLRRVFIATCLVAVLSLLSAQDLAAQPRSRWTEGEVGPARLFAGLPSSLWEVLASLLLKASVRIDPDGNKASVRIDPDGNKASVRIDPDGILQASVRIDPDGGH